MFGFRPRYYGVANFSMFFLVILAIESLLMISAVSKFGFEAMSRSGDGPEYMEFAMRLESGDYPYPHFPMYAVLIRAASIVFPLSAAAILVSVVAYLLTTVVFWKTSAHSCFAGGMFLPLLMSVYPPTLLVYSISPVADATAVFFTALTYYFLISRREKSMLLSSMLAVASHYMAMLAWPGIIYYFFRKNLREIPKAILTVLPSALLSCYQYVVRGNLFFYLSVHEGYWSARGGILSYPFAAIPYVVSNFGLFSVALLLSTYVVYVIGLVLVVKRRENETITFSILYVAFIIMLSPKGFYFVPRFAAYAFPLILAFGNLKQRALTAGFLSVSAVSIAYAFYRVLFL